MDQQDLVGLSPEEQEQAVAKIHALMREGVSSGQAIALVAEEIRQRKSKGENQ